MQILALISVYSPVVIIVVAVIAVLFSFFWVFVPLPRAMCHLLIRFWLWRERRRRGSRDLQVLSCAILA
jgi:hypothetical protein